MSETPLVNPTPAAPAARPGAEALLPGWYGKLPHLGDFASRRLPEAFVSGWDAWLRHALANSREALGPRWLQGYLVAPIVRFWLPPGLLGESAWAGLLMPSIDRVGRHFPLTVAQPGVALAQAQAAPGWFEALDAAMRRALDVSFTVDDLERALAQAVRDAPLPADTPGAPGGEGGWPWAEAGAAAPTGSLWWFARAGGELRCRFDALPPAMAGAELLGACA
jgi:type VI secretion system protein ImpM